MRKRIPVRSIDVLTPEGRPGPLTRLAFLVKEHWPNQSINLTEAKKNFGLATGYRTFNEALLSGKANSEPMPAPGSISRSELQDILMWGFHRKAGLSFLEAQSVVKGLDLTQLAIDKVTRERLFEAQRSDASTKFVMVDEFHQMMHQPWPALSPALFAAGAPAFTYSVYSDGSTLIWDVLCQCADDLHPDVVSMLREEDRYALATTDDEVLTAYLKDEFIPGIRVPVEKAVREHAMLPAGLEICWLFNRAGEFRGRCLANNHLGGLQPAVHWDDSIYEDAITLLCGRPPRYTHQSPSFEGAGKGQAIHAGNGPLVFNDAPLDDLPPGRMQLINQGDEALYTFRYLSSSRERDLSAMADAGEGGQISVSTVELVLMPGIVLTDMRFKMPAFSIDMKPLQVFENGAFTPRASGTHALCGNMMLGDHQYIRFQKWITPNDVPAVLRRFPAKVESEPHLSMDPVSSHHRNQDAALNALVDSASTLAQADLGRPGTLRYIRSVVSRTAEWDILSAIKRFVAAAIDEQLPLHANGWENDVHSFELVERELEHQQDREKELGTLQHLGRGVVSVRPDLEELGEEALGWLLLLAFDEYPGSRQASWIRSEELDSEEGSAKFNAYLVAVALAAVGDVTSRDLPTGQSLLLAVHALFDGVIKSSQLVATANECKTFISVLRTQRQKIKDMDKWMATSARRESACRLGGFLSVGEPVTKPVGLQDMFAATRGLNISPQQFEHDFSKVKP